MAMAATLISGLSQAEPIPRASVAWPGMTQDDIDRMQAAAARLYEGRSIGSVERWFSPDTKNAGEVKLVRSFTAKGMPCREVDYVIRFQTARDNLTHYVANWCKIPDGEWKIVEIPRSH
jgi:surface antigen